MYTIQHAVNNFGASSMYFAASNYFGLLVDASYNWTANFYHAGAAYGCHAKAAGPINNELVYLVSTYQTTTGQGALYRDGVLQCSIQGPTDGGLLDGNSGTQISFGVAGAVEPMTGFLCHPLILASSVTAAQALQMYQTEIGQ